MFCNNDRRRVGRGKLTIAWTQTRPTAAYGATAQKEQIVAEFASECSLVPIAEVDVGTQDHANLHLFHAHSAAIQLFLPAHFLSGPNFARDSAGFQDTLARLRWRSRASTTDGRPTGRGPFAERPVLIDGPVIDDPYLGRHEIVLICLLLYNR